MPHYALQARNPYKIQKNLIFLHIHLYMSKFFRTFAAGFLVRTHVHIRTYEQTQQTTIKPNATMSKLIHIDQDYKQWIQDLKITKKN